MANEFIIKNGFHSKGNSQITGSLEIEGIGNVSASIAAASIPAGTVSGSGQITELGFVTSSATASFVNNSATSSFVNNSATASFLTSNDTGSLGSTTITGSLNLTGTFIGNGSTLTNLQRPITSSGVNFSASVDNAGYYFRTGGNVTCSIGTTSATSITVGTEYEFFQTASAGYLCFTTASGVTLNSKSGKTKLAGQFSAATLKKVATDTYDLIGDLD